MNEKQFGNNVERWPDNGAVNFFNNMEFIRNLENIFDILARENSYDLGKISYTENGIASFLGGTDEFDENLISKNLEKVSTSTELLLKIIKKNYNPRYNSLIEYIFNQTRSYTDSLINNDVSTLPIHNLVNVIDLIIDISFSNSCGTIIKKLSDYYKCIINNLNCNSEFLSLGIITFYLNIILVFYETVHNVKVKNSGEDIEKFCKMITTDSCECKLFSKLIMYNSEIVAAQILINLIPKYVQITHNNLIFKFIWNKISESLIDKKLKHSRIFVVLCYLSSELLVTANKDLICEIFETENYWLLLQRGLIHLDSSIRKQALFLMKISLNYIIVKKIDFSHKKYIYLGSNDGDKFLINLMSDTKFEEFKEMCIIIEYLEEKQAHIVRPIFNLIQNFINNNAGKMHLSWLLIIIQRMIGHDNMKIIRYGISNLLKISVDLYDDEATMIVAIKLLISSLNNTHVYMLDLSELLDELENYFFECSTSRNGKLFFKLFLRELCNVTWSSEALFFMTYSFQSVCSKNYWGKEELDLIKKFITSGTVNHYTYIKSGIQNQLLQTTINLMDASLTLADIATLLSCFDNKTSCLQKGTVLWQNLGKWIAQNYTAEETKNFVCETISKANYSMNFGKLIFISYDAFSNGKMFCGLVQKIIKNIPQIFESRIARPYCDQENTKFFLSLFCELIAIFSGQTYFLQNNLNFLKYVLLCIEMQFNLIHDVRDYETSEILMEELETTLNFYKHVPVVVDAVQKWFDTNIDNLNLPQKSAMQKFIQINILCTLMRHNNDLASRNKVELLKSYLKNQLNSCLLKKTENSARDEDLLKLWGKMNSAYLEHKWQLLSYITFTSKEILGMNQDDFLQLCFQVLDIGGSAVLLPLMTILGKILPSLENESNREKIIDSIWNIMMERKKNEEFYKLIKTFVETLFQLNMLETQDNTNRSILLKYSRRLLLEGTLNSANIFLKHIKKIGFNTEITYFFLDLLPFALLYGHPQRRNLRLISDICSIIESKKLSPLTNDFVSSNEIRATAVGIVSFLDPKNDSHSHFAEELIDALIALEESIAKNKIRYFSDSHVHRVKQRLMQCLLVLESYISKEKAEKLWEWLINKLILENNQPSVRYLQEWLIVRILNRNSDLRERIWEFFDEGLEKRTGSLCSLISVVYHLVKCIPSESWIDSSMQTFLPYCMAQHFSVRLYAQVTLRKLIDLAESLKLTGVVEKYSVVSKSLTQSIERGNSVKNCDKLKEDFYFTVFNPLEHYSIETIFYDFPRLTNVGSDEQITLELFQRCGFNENCQIPLKNENSSLKSFAPGKWVAGRSKQRDSIQVFEDDSELSNYQKKIIPVKCLLPNWEELLQYRSSTNKNDKEGLIVVASLIDRLPNLGGLSRTCEIFGASELVIASLKYVEDQQFQSLSVTAEKWISITEVKPQHLPDYLITMKKNGYTILGAEQTINSQPLESVKFPKKSILVLGNEKEGIPAPLLPLIEICIEIPQKGVIRSLNVHVTGALFVWEYAKQHYFSNQLNDNTDAS